MLAQAAVFLSISTLVMLLVYAARSDLASFRIPNAISLTLLLTAPLFWWALDSHPNLVFAGVWPSLLTALVVFAIGFGLFATGLMGAGDVKLMSVLALWIGPAFAARIFTLIVLAGGVVALIIAIRALLKRRATQDGSKHSPIGKQHVPYGVAIAFGGWVFSGQLILNALAQ
ncbi:MAG: prepilin peptidase [Sphingomonadales bacterium]|jgi:prepilin peptidase CpaA